ncbi:MAG: SGNH/GDSL hydrolase family protein [Polyangiales bacterium]
MRDRALASELLALLVALALGCGHEDVRPLPPSPPRKPDSARFYTASHVAVRYEGRIDARDPDAPRFAWPASGFRLRFRGTRLVLRFRDVPYTDEIHDTDLLAAYVDSRAPVTIPLVEGVRDYPIVEGLPDGVHEVRILKRTEAEAGTVTFLGADVAPGQRFLEPPPPFRRRILAVGDSITAGYGIDGPDANCHFSAGTENATRSYAFLAAKTLEAGYQAIAWSGRGVYRNYDPGHPETIPSVYDRVIPTEPEPLYDPAAFDPQAVVLNLGTNDLFRPHPDRAAFVAAYAGLLDRIRRDHPRAHLVLVVGPMLADDYPPHSHALSKALQWVGGLVDARRRAGDRRISFLQLYGADPADGYGCDYHPSFTTHRKMAEALVAHLRARAGF